MTLLQGKLHLQRLLERLRAHFGRAATKPPTRILTRADRTRIGQRLDAWVHEGHFRIRYNSIDEILEELGLTSGELSSYCSSTLKMNFLSWRKELRVNEAKRLLVENPSEPAYKIGQYLGIDDKSNFRHQFKSVTGLTPTQWRKIHLPQEKI